MILGATTMNNKKDILIVDDISVNLSFFHEILKDTYNIRLTTNGKLAIESAKKKCPDLIILDVKMPILDGYEVCKILKSDPVTKNAPVIFITGSIDSDDRDKGYAVGGIDYLIKPFDSNELKSKLKSTLEGIQKVE